LLENASATVIGRDPNIGNWVELDDEDNLCSCHISETPAVGNESGGGHV
jgi:hypothetical protein